MVVFLFLSELGKSILFVKQDCIEVRINCYEPKSGVIADSFSDRVDGEEATRNGILIWDALALKGSCHIWIDGDCDKPTDGSFAFRMWNGEEAPSDAVSGDIFYLTSDCPGMSPSARIGQIWQAVKTMGDDGSEKIAWQPYSGEIEVS